MYFFVFGMETCAILCIPVQISYQNDFRFFLRGWMMFCVFNNDQHIVHISMKHTQTQYDLKP